MPECHHSCAGNGADEKNHSSSALFHGFFTEFVMGRISFFIEAWKEKHPFIKAGSSKSVAYCSKCNCEISISNGGLTAIDRHVETSKHKKNSVASVLSVKLTDHFRNRTLGKAERELAAAEGLFAYHTVKHNQSFKSLDCTSKLVNHLYDKKFTCARTKAQKIIQNVICPYAAGILGTDLEAANFVSIYYDASNHGDVKMMPVLVRYFNAADGIKVKVLELSSLTGETSELICEYLKCLLIGKKIQSKVIGICADNTNTNFGGSRRGGQQNVYFLMKAYLNKEIYGIGCSAHVVHNGIKTAADCLPLDCEIFVGKVCQYFSIYTVRTESLKEFCTFCDVEYGRVQSYSKSRFLALLPGLERILKIFEALKSYFLSAEKVPVTIMRFIEDPSAEFWLYFLHSQAFLFHNTVLALESQSMTITAAAGVLKKLKTQLECRKMDHFVPFRGQELLEKLEDDGHIRKQTVLNQIENFYTTALDYIQEWAGYYDEFLDLYWIDLEKELPEWNRVQISVRGIVDRMALHGMNINDSHLYGQYIEARAITMESSWKEFEESSGTATTGEKWAKLFTQMKAANSSITELAMFVEYILCIPGSNASTERVFSHINGLCTKEKSNLSLELLKAMVLSKLNLEYECKAFYEHILKKPKILSAIHGSAKYEGPVAPEESASSSSASAGKDNSNN